MATEHDTPPHCGCPMTHNFADNKYLVEHRPTCPHHPDRINAAKLAADAPAPAPVASMDLARFKRADKPAEVNARAALEAAMEWIDDPETPKPTHIIVLVGRDASEPGQEGASATRFFQAGGYRHHGQMGLCLEAMHMIRESGSGN